MLQRIPQVRGAVKTKAQELVVSHYGLLGNKASIAAKVEQLVGKKRYFTYRNPEEVCFSPLFYLSQLSDSVFFPEKGSLW